MSRFYTDPKRESHPTALPDAEVFFRTLKQNREDGWVDADEDPMPAGWYYWFCLPGCMPDSEPEGPFESEAAAVADARERFGDDEE